MIYDANGNLWATPRTIGFHRNPQATSHEVADHVTFSTPDRSQPRWVEDSEPSHWEPYCTRRITANGAIVCRPPTHVCD